MPTSSIPPAGDPNAPKDTDKTPKSTGAKPIHYQDQGGKTHRYLNMDFTQDQWDQLWQATIQSVNGAIQKNKEKSVKAIKNFGKDPDEQT
jgi:hypothetical protein